MAETKKPEASSNGWSELTRDRNQKWQKMWADYAAEGLTPIPLWAEGNLPVPHAAGFVPQLLVYPAHEGKPRGLLIVCAGGAFMFKSSNEAKPVADYFYQAGLNAAVLDYNVNPDREMGGDDCQRAAAADALRAIRTVRANAAKWNILPDKIAIGGFSAGGMVSGMAGVYFDAGDPDAADPVERVSSRPDACVLVYSAFVSDRACVGAPGRTYDAGAMNRAMTSPSHYDNHLRPDTPPFFVTQTCWDDPRGAMYLGIQLANRGIPFEVHTFEDGTHGGALYDGVDPDTPLVKHTSMWAKIAADWLIETRGFVET